MAVRYGENHSCPSGGTERRTPGRGDDPGGLSMIVRRAISRSTPSRASAAAGGTKPSKPIRPIAAGGLGTAAGIRTSHRGSADMEFWIASPNET